MIEFSLVDVVSIKSKKSRSSFPEEHIEKLAQSIVRSGGLLQPIILNQIDLESYEVISGDFEFFAAKRAKEIDPRKGEMVSAFVCPKQISEAVDAQIQLLRRVDPPPPPSPDDQRLINLETRLDKAIEDINKSHLQEIQRLNREISEIRQNIPPKIETLEAFNQLPLPILARKLQSANVKGKTAEKMIVNIENERNKAPFGSIADIVRRVDGLGDKRMIAIVDALNGIF